LLPTEYPPLWCEYSSGPLSLAEAKADALYSSLNVSVCPSSSLPEDSTASAIAPGSPPLSTAGSSSFTSSLLSAASLVAQFSRFLVPRLRCLLGLEDFSFVHAFSYHRDDCPFSRVQRRFYFAHLLGHHCLQFGKRCCAIALRTCPPLVQPLDVRQDGSDLWTFVLSLFPRCHCRVSLYFDSTTCEFCDNWSSANAALSSALLCPFQGVTLPVRLLGISRHDFDHFGLPRLHLSHVMGLDCPSP
jgi:hypothetical protein